MSFPEDRTLKIAVVQPALAIGEVEANLARIDDLVRSAHREHSPELILVPESMTTPNVYARAMRHVARPVDGQPFQMLTRLARELGCTVGGGFVAVRGNDTYGTFVLAEPDGSAHLHDKDIPTLWEQNYYRGGDDDGFIGDSSLGPIGCASGWEWARTRTARRLRGRVRLLAGGMCWPSFGRYPGIIDAPMRRERETQSRLAEALPGQMARMLGAPVAIASHVGDVDFDTPLAPGVAWRTGMVGESQIVERDGTVLARMDEADGEGHLSAEVRLAAPEPLDDIPDRYWIPKMPASIHTLWNPVNLHGKVKYEALKRLGRHPWQEVAGPDLPDRVLA